MGSGHLASGGGLRGRAEIMNIDDLSKRVHEAALANGWWDARNSIRQAAAVRGLGPEATANIIIAALGLICAEAGEAMESVRANYAPDDKLPEYSGYAVELADIIIRALDLCGQSRIPIGEIIEKKLAANEKRGRMHGGKLA